MPFVIDWHPFAGARPILRSIFLMLAVIRGEPKPIRNRASNWRNSSGTEAARKATQKRRETAHRAVRERLKGDRGIDTARE